MAIGLERKMNMDSLFVFEPPLKIFFHVLVYVRYNNRRINNLG
ncbi:MAG: hypothetical protein QXS93_03220 [Candidatus Micrarchaeia archaeon]